MRSEEWAKLTRVVPQHQAKRAKGPGARPWSGSRGETHCGGLGAKPLAEYEAEPHSAKADKVQIKVKKARKRGALYESCIGAQKSAPLPLSPSKCKSAKSEAILRHSKLARIIRRGEHRSPAWYATSAM